jgi:hypothetical protein
VLLEALGVMAVLATIWAALQFEGTPGIEGGTHSDEGGLVVSDAASVARIPESQMRDVSARILEAS